MSFKTGTNICHPEGETRRILKKKDKKCAFTLAEVLITLGIIGIIVAMTLPALVGKYQKQVTVTKLKKAYTVLSQMVMQSQEDNGPAAFSSASRLEADEVQTFFDMYWKPYFNSPSVSSNATNFPYGIANAYTDMNGVQHSLYIYTNYSAGRIFFSTNDGVCYLVIMVKWDQEYDEEGNPVTFYRYAPQQTVYVDIDGIKGKNTLGKDVFEFVVDFDSNLVRPYGYNKTISEINTDCSHTGMGQYCAAKIMNDSWEIKNDYPW